MPKTNPTLLEHAKTMHREMTPCEARLWYHLRAKRLNDMKFVRQSVRRPYIADFIARSHKLIIEVDGDTHGLTEHYDAKRTAKLEAKGYRVLRFTNADVMRNLEGVLTVILATLSPPGRGTASEARQGEGQSGKAVERGYVENDDCPSPQPSPRRGEGASSP